MEAHTIKTSARGQHLDCRSRQGSLEWVTSMTRGLLHDPVCHPGNKKGVRPWPCRLEAGRGPDGVDDHVPVKETGKARINRR